jgi:drug/metabolite transporter (DMT)-like permease
LAPVRYLAPYVLILAFQYVVAKDALNYATPATVELVVCALTFAVLFSITGGKVILTRQTLVFSFFFWASGACWLFGLNYISSAQSAILSFTMPLFAIPLSVYMLGERSSRLEVYGGLVGFFGVILFNLPLLNGGLQTLGIALALGGALFWAVFSVYMKRLSSQDPLRTLTTGFLFCVPPWAVLAVVDFGIKPSFDFGFDIAYLALGASIVNLFLWAALLKLERVTKLTVVIFVTPVITLVYTVITTDVLPSYLTLAGVALIFVGIYASNILGHRGEESAPSPAPGDAPRAPISASD